MTYIHILATRFGGSEVTLEVGKRYRFNLSDIHPVELSSGGDDNLLLAQSALDGCLEEDENVDFVAENTYITSL